MKEDKAYIGDEIVEGNKLIAEFMGAVWKEDDYGDFGFFFPFMMHRPTSVDALKYHCDWSWLMPVVERIEKECFKVLISTFGLSDWHYTEIRKGTKRCGYGKSEKKIESTWIAVVDFIKNYNQNKQS